MISQTIGSVKTLVHTFDKSDVSIPSTHSHPYIGLHVWSLLPLTIILFFKISDSTQVLHDNNFQGLFFKQLQELQLNQTFTNIELLGSDSEKDVAGVACDAVIMAAYSSLVRERFQKHVHSKNDNPLIIRLDNVSEAYLSAVVEYVYSGGVNFTEVDCKQLFKASVHLKVTTLQVFCGRVENEVNTLCLCGI